MDPRNDEHERPPDVQRHLVAYLISYMLPSRQCEPLSPGECISELREEECPRPFFQQLENTLLMVCVLCCHDYEHPRVLPSSPPSIVLKRKRKRSFLFVISMQIQVAHPVNAYLYIYIGSPTLSPRKKISRAAHTLNHVNHIFDGCVASMIVLVV